MNIHLENIKKLLQDTNLPQEEKQLLLKRISDADKQWAITDFKLDRTEKVKRTTAFLLEETIEELELKRKAVEGQNRELEIEASLERVRSVAMSMMKADDLLDVGKVQFNELKQLGFSEMRNALIGIFDDAKNHFTDYDYSDYSGGSITQIPYHKNRVVDNAIKRMKSATDAFTEFVVEGKELEEWKAFRKQNGEYDDARINETDCLYYYFYSIESGNVGISTFKKINEEQLNILKRFRNVFDLAYRRYVDINNATAQAREAQIEAALERVRSRSMGMQKSEELKEVIKIVYQQLTHLKINLDHAGFVVDYTPKGNWHFWIADEQDIPSKITHPYFESVWATQFDEAKETGAGFFATHLNFEETNKFYKELLSFVPGLPEASKEFYLSCPSLAATTVLFDNVSLYIKNFTGTPYKDEENAVLMRFGNVFQQTYTRFLDLQKAEAQSRESQIELGLERVRARAMAMQKSDELAELVDTVFKELTKLDFALNWCIINIIDEPSLTNMVWAANPETNKPPDCYLMKFEDYPFHHSMLKGYQERKLKHVYVLEGKEKKEYDDYLFNKTEWKRVPKKAQAASRAMKRYVASFTFSNFGGLQTVGEEPMSKENLDILSRFGKVFDLTYTRFNDLQKAEAQAREAQIEAALEKVRSSSLAMHHSTELEQVAGSLFDRLTELGLSFDGAFIFIFDKEKRNISLWIATTHLSAPVKIDLPYDKEVENNSILKGLWNAIENGERIISKSYSGEVKNEYFRYVAKYNESKIPESVRQFQIESESWTAHLVAEKNSMIGFDSWSEYPTKEEDFKILIRFAKVFEQAYTRFLDLQKAEAQAREAQIELAMERVRSRTMAMHKSEEVMDVAGTLFEELQKLGFAFGASSILIIDKESGDAEYWMAGFSKEKFPESYQIKYFQHPYHDALLTAWKNGHKSFIYTLAGAGKKNYDEVLFTQTGYKYIPEEEQKLMRGIESVTFSIAYMKHGALHWGPSPLNEQQTKILERFAKVFEQSYTRFLDLQKAEAQAREAKIEAALEKVRNRTLLMKDSRELNEAVAVFFQQFESLNLLPEEARTYFCHIDSDAEVAEVWMTHTDGMVMSTSHQTPLTKSSSLSNYFDAWKRKEPILVRNYSGEALTGYLQFLSTLPHVKADKDYQQLFSSPPEKIVMTDANFLQGNISIMTFKPLTQEALDILVRFAKVFEFTYTRFLDLQKAEAQAREAQIELGLERVRARAMAMQRSAELAELVHTVFKELTNLHFSLDRCIIMINDPQTNGSTWWMSNSEKASLPIGSFVKYHEHPPYLAYINAWKARTLKWRYLLQGTEKKEWDEFLFAETELSLLPQFVINGMKAIESIFLNVSFNNFGSLTLASLEELSEEHFDIMLRFAKVFEQTYTRFLDLQKAEAQAREARMEGALEKVRSRSLAMHKSDELSEVILEIQKKFQQLDISMESRVAVVVVFDKQSRDFNQWVASPDFSNIYISTPYFQNPILDDFWTAKEGGVDFYSKTYSQEVKNSYFKYFFENSNYENIEGLEEQKKWLFERAFYAYSPAFEKNSSIGIADFSGKPLTESDIEIIKRFAKVFEQAYTRFLDLQKAEAQAREAKIEAAVERVRAKSMAMYKTSDLYKVNEEIYGQLNQLKVDGLTGVSIYLVDENDVVKVWDLSSPGNISDPSSYTIKYDAKKYPVLGGWVETWKTSNQDYFILDFSKDDLILAVEEFKEILPEMAVHFKNAIESGQLQHQWSPAGRLSDGLIAIDLVKPPTEDTKSIVTKMAGAFNLAYQRFLDLQKADVQAREAEIELALERVRARTMAMQKSEELHETSQILFQQMKALGEPVEQLTIGIVKETENMVEVFATVLGSQLQQSFPHSIDEPTVMNKIYRGWKAQQKSLLVEMNSNDIQVYNRYRNELVKSEMFSTTVSKDERRIIYAAYFSKGMLALGSNTPLSEESHRLLERFAGVFEGTYTRFLDLQKAEAQAKEAQIETGLERVRSRTLAMQKSDDLAETAAEVFKQLISLGIEPNRLYIGIVKDESGDMEMWATDEDGTKVGQKFIFNKNENASVKKLYDGWVAKEKSIIVDMQGKELEDYFHYLNDVMHIPFKDGLTQKRRVQSVAYFSKGFIGMASPDGQGSDTLQLLERFAAVFNLTFTRFNDLKIAEAHAQQAEQDLIAIKESRQNAEVALVELQATQRQLIQSAKMASLGELTAGIAHEIQNPLNFVNNFSEVSKELLDEMRAAIDQGDTEEAKEIMNDVIQNLEKINHHGKRADGIVKGMLQHSSSGSGQKELTDINALCDEYLRLSYHGLRAKDKSFNAKFETHFDEAVGNLNVIPQDIGRVVLNLINNAFYAVSERKKLNDLGYEPTVVVSTIKEANNMKIKVIDNGIGISQNIVDKIFQPFFTTKPTGQGTGLGLSLSYDIVKAHGGEIMVSTKENEGTEFTIQLATS